MLLMSFAGIKMVEAAGIEPASEDIATWTSTSLSLNLVFAFKAGKGTIPKSYPA